MSDKRGKNTAASVRDRLLSLARERGEDFQLILRLERHLYHLGKSDYRDRFVLKGAMLFILWVINHTARHSMWISSASATAANVLAECSQERLNDGENPFLY